MAIKVTGTTVINDSRQLENINNTSDLVQSASFIRVPELFVDGIPDNVIVEPTLTTSEFSVFGSDSDTHASTDWEVIRTSDSTTVFSSIGDTVNLTSITVSPALDGLEEYLFRVRHNGTNLGASVYREFIATTLDPFAVVNLGDSFFGGFYMGAICTSGQCYALIVAPNATGCTCCQWKTTNTCTGGADSLNDGYGTTYSVLNNSSHPAGNWTATRTINGFSDWYLPAAEELAVFYNNGAGTTVVLPAGEDFVDSSYWSSTEYCTTIAYKVYLGGLSYGQSFKINSGRVRAVRREPF